MKLIKKQIPLAIVFITGVLTLVSYYVPHKMSVNYIETINKWENIVVAFAFLLGLVSLFFSHYNKISRKVDGWGYSIFVFIGFLAMIVPAFYSQGKQTTELGLTALGWSYRHIYTALAGTMFAV